MPRLKPPIGRSPLTDPRSVAGSLLFHSFLLVVASFAALSLSQPQRPPLPHVLRGEIDTVDNRVPSREGGGGAGELGGTGAVEVAPTADGSSPQGAARDPAADALLSEILPTTTPVDASQRALPGPLTTGVGILPGPGAGGGGGSGGGSGGGAGRGIGPGTEFFGARERAGSFAYVIDRSGSMAMRGSLDVAKRELTASLNQLPPDARFGVIFYSLESSVLSPAGQIQVLKSIEDLAKQRGNWGLAPATTANKARVGSQLALVDADGGTDHMLALRTAIAMRPEVIFFLTDADMMTDTDVNEIVAEAKSIRIQAVEFGLGANLAGQNAPLRRLATTTGGSYRYIDVGKFPQPTR